METTTFKEIKKKPKREYHAGQFCTPLMEFMESDEGTLKYTCANMKEARKCYLSLYQYIRRHELNAVMWRSRSDVYVVKG